SSIHRRSRHSREGGNPLLVGSPGPPAYAGVTTRRFSSPWAAGPPTLRMTCRDFSATSQISVPPRREQNRCQDHHGDEQGPLNVQRSLVGIDRLDGLAHRKAEFDEYQTDAVHGVVGESRENQKLPELEERLVKDSPLDPQVYAFGAQARNHNVHQKVAKNAQAGEAMQDVGVTLDAPAPTPEPSPQPEPIVVPYDFGHASLPNKLSALSRQLSAKKQMKL